MIGKKLAERYEITAELGRGGMGVVYPRPRPRAEPRGRGQAHPPSQLSPDSEHRFQREAPTLMTYYAASNINRGPLADRALRQRLVQALYRELDREADDRLGESSRRLARPSHPQPTTKAGALVERAGLARPHCLGHPGRASSVR